MTVCEEAQGIVYRNIHFVYMIKGSCIKRVHVLISITEQLIRLMPGRYVGIEEEEDDGVPFEEKMEKLTNKYYELSDHVLELTKQIQKIFEGLGYGR